MLEQVRQTIRQHAMLAPGDVVLVAVSGGADSCALGHVLCLLRAEYDLTLHWVHLHHGVRGMNADRDAELVAELAGRWAVPCTVRHLHLERELPRRSGWEAMARHARYAQYAAVAREVGATRVAVAHHLDDQAETVIMRLVRGTGARGLGGIPPVRPLNAADPSGPALIRPMLDVRKSAIEAYCREQNVPFGVDETNQDTRFLRNRIRHQVMPALSALNARVPEHLAAAAAAVRVDNECLDQLAQAALQRCGCRTASARLRVPMAALEQEHPAVARRMLRLAAEYLGTPLDAEGTERIWRLGQERGGSPVILAGELAVTVRKDAVDFELMGGAQASFSMESLPEPTVVQLQVPGISHIPRLGCLVAVRPAACGGPEGGNGVFVDPAKLPGPLGVRSRRPGDRIWPVGMSGSTKVQDLLVNAKVPREQRDNVPILVAGDEVVWVIGHRVDRRYLASAPGEGWEISVAPLPAARP